MASGELKMTLEGHTRWVRSVAFSPDGKTLVSGSEDSPTIRLWGRRHRPISGYARRAQVSTFYLFGGVFTGWQDAGQR